MFQNGSSSLATIYEYSVGSSLFSAGWEFTLALSPAPKGRGPTGLYALSPGERGSLVTSLDNFSIFVAVTDSVSFTNKTHANTSYYIAQNAANDFPLLGERAGERADVVTDFICLRRVGFRRSTYRILTTAPASPSAGGAGQSGPGSGAETAFRRARRRGCPAARPMSIADG